MIEDAIVQGAAGGVPLAVVAYAIVSELRQMRQEVSGLSAAIWRKIGQEEKK